MTSVTPVERRRRVVIGVDTHKDFHVAVALDHNGGRLGELQFATSQAGLAQLEVWAAEFGEIEAWGVEGTASYGAGLTRRLLRAGHAVLEVNRPDRHARRTLGGKSDPIDAEAAARAALSGRTHIQPKSQDGPVEMLRHVRMARSSAVKAQTVAMNQIHAIVITAPGELRDRLSGLRAIALIDACTALQPTPELTLDNTVSTTLRTLALRWRHLQAEARTATKLLTQLVTALAPRLIAQHGVGPDTAAALLISAGDNPHRLHSEAAFAALCGANPIPAKSGNTNNRYRLNRGGDRQANAALHRIVLVRLVHHDPTKTYMAARRTPNRSNSMHVMRCLKRYLARQLYPLVLEAISKPEAPPLAA
jgi:transposase